MAGGERKERSIGGEDSPPLFYSTSVRDSHRAPLNQRKRSMKHHHTRSPEPQRTELNVHVLRPCLFDARTRGKKRGFPASSSPVTLYDFGAAAAERRIGAAVLKPLLPIRTADWVGDGGGTDLCDPFSGFYDWRGR